MARVTQFDRHQIKAEVMRKGVTKYGQDFSLWFLSWLYHEKISAVPGALRANPQSRKGKIIVAHFLGKEPKTLWPGEDWRRMDLTYTPCLRSQATTEQFRSARQNEPLSQTREAA